MAVTTPNGPDDTGAPDRQLACGRDPVEVIDRARAGRSTEHEQACPHCLAAIDADRVTGTAAVELAEAERDQPVPSTLLPGIMRSVWSDLRRSTMIPLATDGGSAFVADHTVAAVIEHALGRLTELQIHTCTARMVGSDDPDPDRGAAGTIAIDVTAAAAYNADVRAVAAQAREITRRTMAEQFGWTAEPIDIDVVDVYVPGGGNQ